MLARAMCALWENDYEMEAVMSGEELTDAEWREFQSIPDQGYSHRAWVDSKIKARLDAAKSEPAQRQDDTENGAVATSGTVTIDRDALIAAAAPFKFEHFSDDDVHLGPCVLVADLPKVALAAQPSPLIDRDALIRVLDENTDQARLSGYGDVSFTSDIEDLADAVIAHLAIAGGAEKISEQQVWQMARYQHDFVLDSDNVPAFVEPLLGALREAGVPFDEQPFIEGGYLLPAEAALAAQPMTGAVEWEFFNNDMSGWVHIPGFNDEARARSNAKYFGHQRVRSRTVAISEWVETTTRNPRTPGEETTP